MRRVRTCIINGGNIIRRSYHIGIIGGGLAGLATAYYAVKFIPNVKITIYDAASGPGEGGASSAPVTLLHPFTPKGKEIKDGLDGFQCVLDIINDIEYNNNCESRIFRPFFEKKKYETYQKNIEVSLHLTDVHHPGQCAAIFPKSCPVLSGMVGGVFLHQSRIIDTPTYLRDIWRFIQKHSSVEWIERKIQSIEELETKFHYDVVIVSCGSCSPVIWESSQRGDDRIDLSYHYSEGSTVILPDPLCSFSEGKHLGGLRHAIISGDYVIPHPTRDGYLLCGATRNKIGIPQQLQNVELFKTQSFQLLIERISRLYPPLANCEITTHADNTWTGVKVYASHIEDIGQPRYPVLIQHQNNKRLWLFTGLGSRGLIHHAVGAKRLVTSLMR